jgi:hypothetical protein
MDVVRHMCLSDRPCVVLLQGDLAPGAKCFGKEVRALYTEKGRIGWRRPSVLTLHIFGGEIWGLVSPEIRVLVRGVAAVPRVCCIAIDEV